MQAHGDCLETPKVPALVDFDCHEGNIFVKQGADGWHISGIVDLERAFWGDPIGDFPTAFIFCDDIRKEKVLLETYLEKSDEIRAYTGTEVRKFLLPHVCADNYDRRNFSVRRIGLWKTARRYLPGKI